LLALPIERFFRLSEAGVRCGPDGLYVGPTPLIARAGAGWAARPRAELEEELSDLYGLPIDLGGREDRLAGIARAFARGEPALAAIGALLLRFPDPPSLAKGAPARGSAELARRLFDSGLLDKDWDPAKHPRVGEPPNPGWFAAKPEDVSSAGPPSAPSPSLSRREIFRLGLRFMRGLIAETADKVLRSGKLALWLAPKLCGPIQLVVELLDSSELDPDEQRSIDQGRASVDPPKTLEELQRPPTQNVLGYERHHIVEQNPDNIAKGPDVEAIEKFGRDLIDDPSNIVWIPRFKHEQITRYYNSEDRDDPLRRIHRKVVNDLDFAGQRAAGLEALRKFGVLI
jgi:hypothetical protein